MKLLLSRIPCPSTSKQQLPTITTPADHTITVANDLLQLLRFLCQLIFLVHQLSSFRIVEDSIEATALPIFTARRGVAGIYIILELLDSSCMSMSMDATVLIKSV